MALHSPAPRQGLDLMRTAMSSSASSRRSLAAALKAASVYLKTSHIEASRHAGSVDCPLDHVKRDADSLMALHRARGAGGRSATTPLSLSTTSSASDKPQQFAEHLGVVLAEQRRALPPVPTAAVEDRAR